MDTFHFSALLQRVTNSQENKESTKSSATAAAFLPSVKVEEKNEEEEEEGPENLTNGRHGKVLSNSLLLL